MKKGLMLVEDCYINMDSIVEWWFDKDSIHIANTLTDGDPKLIVTEGSEHDIGVAHRVTINEFHRIIREISEYMGCVK